MKPKFSIKTWQAAASQVFFSLGLSFGSLMAYSASNKFKNNFFRLFICLIKIMNSSFS
jgi:SNF family Na+-dependent transporter